MTVLSFVPVGCALILLLVKPLLEREGVLLSALYPQMSFFLFLHFLMPLMSVFIGTAVIGDEVEERTLPYLLVRPFPRWTIVVSKTLAGCITVGSIIFISMVLTYSIMVISGGFKAWIADVPTLLQSLGVLYLGLLVYIPFFGLLGGTIKRPVLAGLLFSFGWENTVGMFPGNVKLLTVVHYLHVLFPKMHRIQSNDARRVLLDLVLPAKQVSIVTSILVLLGLSALFTGLMVSLLYLKEYRLEQE